MGNVVFGVPEDLALDLAKSIKARMFIETGTYKGNTALWASKNFYKVVTIEFDKNRYQKTFVKISNMIDTSNINMLQGNSKDVLKTVLDKTNEPVIFWLDAHGLGLSQILSTQEEEIPLIQELDVIFNWQKRTKKECCILIDDARLFIDPPPIDKGYHPEFWPSYSDIVREIDNGLGKNYYVYQSKDVIVIAPIQHESIFDDWSKS